MYKRKSISKLGRKASHRNLLLRNLLTSLIKSGYLTTTTPKAKALKAEFGTVLSLAKKGDDLNSIRMLMAGLNDRAIVEKLITYAKKDEAGVKIMKVGFRPGDNSEKSKVSLVGFEPKKKVVKEKKVAAPKEQKKEVETEKKESIPVKKSKATDFGKAIKDTFTGRKERSRSRSGI